MFMFGAALEARWKSVIHAATECYGQGSFFCMVSMTIDSQLRMRAFDGFCDNLSPVTPLPRDSSVRKVLKGVLKNYDKDAEVYLFRVDDFWQRDGDSVILNGWANGSLTALQ